MRIHWQVSDRFDRRALPIANRHYNRQKIGSPQFVPPGRCMVLLTPRADALWVSSWQKYVQHAWLGAWVCSCFRNESEVLSSELIKEAVAVTRWYWGDPPPLGFITFINTKKVRKKRDWGRCYRKAGWHECGRTNGGLVVLQLLPEEISEEKLVPLGGQLTFSLT